MTLRGSQIQPTMFDLELESTLGVGGGERRTFNAPPPSLPFFVTVTFPPPPPPPPLVQIYFSYPAIIFTKTILSTHLPALDAIMSSVTHQLMIYKYNRLLRVNILTFFTNLFSSCSPNWKMRRETGDGGRGWRGRKRDILKRIRSHGIDRRSNLKTLNCSRYSAVTIFLVEVWVFPSQSISTVFFIQILIFVLSHVFEGSKYYAIYYASLSLSTDQPPPALS